MIRYGFAQRGAPEQLWMGGRPPWLRWQSLLPGAQHGRWWTDRSDRDQLTLFDAPVRDWSRIDYVGLPPLSVTAPHLYTELDDHAAVHRWVPQVRSEIRRRLGIAAAVFGLDAPFREDDIRALPRSARTIGPDWLLEFLDGRGLLGGC